MNQFIGQSQVGERVLVHMIVKIVLVGPKRFTQPMITVEHTGNAVKPESVKMVFIQPESAVGEEKM